MVMCYDVSVLRVNKVFWKDIAKVIIHHNLFITLLLGSIAKTVLVKQPCYISKQKCIDYIEK